MSLRHRIRCAALIVDGDRLLLVKHHIAERGETFWVPPGGGVEGSESFFDCAKREAFEETGLSIELERIVYVRQFIESEANCHHCELFILGRSFSGSLTTANLIGLEDEHYVKDARFLSREEMTNITVWPAILRDGFWDDLARGFPETRYLGIQKA